MAQPDAGAQKENKAKSTSFSRKVVLIKRDDECTSFSDMRSLPCKSNIVLSIGMTKDSVKSEILKIFPYLEEKSRTFPQWPSSGQKEVVAVERKLLWGEAEDTRINPESGNLEGGYPFYIEFRELSDNVSSGRVEFFGVANVVAQRIMQSSTLTGIVPSRLLPGTVKVTATTVASDFLGETHFTYHAKTPPKEVKQLLHNPDQLSSFFGSLSEQLGFPVENECSVGDSYSSVNVQDPASFVQMQKQQSVKILELLLYTAAEEDAQSFVEMLFSTSAGPIVFNYYKSRRPLPEDVAQANGNDELAQYLRDINTRLSKEKPCDTESRAVNWLELAKAVQQQAEIPSDLAQGQSRGLLRNPTENDDEDNSSNNFADSSSSASSDSEDKDLPVLTKFQEDFKRFIAIGVRLSIDEAFKKKNGFTVSEFLQTRRNCAESLRRIAGHIEADTRNTGIVDTTRQVFVIGAYLGLVCADHVGIKAVMGGVTGYLLGLLFSVHGWIGPMIRGVTGYLLGLLLLTIHEWIPAVIGGVTGVHLGLLLLTIHEWIPAVIGGVTGYLLGLLLLTIHEWIPAVIGGVTGVHLGLLLLTIHEWIPAVIGGVTGYLLGLLFSVHGWICPMIRGVTGFVLGLILYTKLCWIYPMLRGVTGVLLGLMLFAILRWILAVIGGVTGYLLGLLFSVHGWIGPMIRGVTDSAAGPAGAARSFNAQRIKSSTIMKDSAEVKHFLDDLENKDTVVNQEVIKSSAIMKASAEVKHFLDDLENKDTVVNQEVKTLKEKAYSMRSAYDNKAVVDWLKDSSAGIHVGFQTHDIKVYGSSILEAQDAKRIASIVLTDIAIMQGVQSGMLGLTPLVGKTLFTAGETTAKMLSESLSVEGIAFAVWDIKEGVANIKGADHATAYRDAAEKIDKSTSQYQEIVEQIDEMCFGATSPQAQ